MKDSERTTAEPVSIQRRDCHGSASGGHISMTTIMSYARHNELSQRFPVSRVRLTPPGFKLLSADFNQLHAVSAELDNPRNE